jgi:hypothetical protein
LRLTDQGPVVKPQVVILGLSYATDLYDLLPPDHGGWIYGGDATRMYFDFDKNGVLQDMRWDPLHQPWGERTARGSNTAAALRSFLEQFAVFRHLRRSKLALAVGSRIRVGGQSLWPNMEIVLERTTSRENEYAWMLFEALLDRIKVESESMGAKLVVVGIPYLPQVYDEIWAATFGNDPRFTRTAACERVAHWARAQGVLYVETLDDFRHEVARRHTWLHYRRDAHPTAEGQRVIGAAVERALAGAGLFAPR